jgi:hypothetical protein
MGHFRASPAVVVKITTEKVPISTLATLTKIVKFDYFCTFFFFFFSLQQNRLFNFFFS